ncbi:MAG: hypothetical protein AAGF71_11810 [Pseudomonadota bacterium]
MRAPSAVLSVAVLGACAAPAGEPSAADRDAANQAVQNVIADSYPDYPFAAVAASCVQSNASDAEILNLAGQTRAMTSKGIATLAIAIANRPETRGCLQSNNVPVLG